MFFFLFGWCTAGDRELELTLLLNHTPNPARNYNIAITMLRLSCFSPPPQGFSV